MRKLFHFILLLCLSAFVSAGATLADSQQPRKVRIVYDNGKVTINGQVFNKPVSVDKWVKALGPYSRADNADTSSPTYFWDGLGIRAVTDHNGKGVIYWFDVFFDHEDIFDDLREKDPDRPPDKVFTGTLILNGVTMTRNTKPWEYNRDTRGNRLRESYKPHLYEFNGVLDGGEYEYSVEGIRKPNGAFREIGFYYYDIKAYRKLNEYKKKVRKIDPDRVKIVFDNGKVTVNGYVFAHPVALDQWVKAIGPYSRVFGKDTKFPVYYWDGLGVMAATDDESNSLVYSFSLFFDRNDDYYDSRKTDMRRPPDRIFLGTFILNGVSLDWRTKLSEYNAKTKGKRLKRLYKAGLYGCSGKLAGGAYDYSVKGTLARDESFEILKFTYLDFQEFHKELNKLEEAFKGKRP